MLVDRLLSAVERRSAPLIGATGLAAGYLFLFSLSGWNPENRHVFSEYPLPGWAHLALAAGAVMAFALCVAAMLLAVTVEARRIDSVRQSLDRRHRLPAGRASPTGREGPARPGPGE
jgi:hypothetical protein